jgi:hypothetical protein
MEGSAAVILWRDWLLVHSWSVTTAGVGVASAPFLRVSSDASDEEIGVTVLDAIAGSKRDVPHPSPSDFPSVLKPLLHLAGVRSNTQLMKDARAIDVRRTGEKFQIISTTNLGPRRGFEHHEPVVFEPDDPAEIGHLVRSGLDNSR